MSKHTPGKWEVRDLIVGVDLNQPLKSLTICKIYGNDKETQANAHLIASAPELLEACKSALSSLLDADWKDNSLDLLRQAITKAEGGR